jgi:phosphatidylserine decarboxylase
MGIDMGESTRSLDEFESFADFFTREIDVGRRPVCSDPLACIAPVDGKVLAFQTVDPETTFPIKRSLFSLSGLLRDPDLTTRFAHGSMVICRLGLADYHHIHFPDSGRPGRAVTIPGRLEAGGPYSLRSLVPFYAENHRMLTPFEADHFGNMVLVEIGALTVGSIRQAFRAGVPVARGAHKGCFELGGSTVVLLFGRGCIELDATLLARTAGGIETRLPMGSPVGRATRRPSSREVRDAGR